ncbi:hypothetical protein [Streptomyces sp. NPDC087300]|uniref:hypothetical protein n=1 Tax=Streptomyces sp. NPDC087300 TaxID=3365780 RepID=UPI003828B6AB
MARRYVEIERGGATSPGGIEAHLYFPATSKPRALEHRAAVLEVARLYGVEWQTPVRAFWDWWARPAERDLRRLEVWGPRRAVARFLVAAPRVVAAIEAQATVGAREFGRWRRSLLVVLSDLLEFEDPTTLRVRAREFRAEVLRHLVGALHEAPVVAGVVDVRRPLWEQAEAVADTIACEAPVDVWAAADPVAVDELLARYVFAEPSVVEVELVADEAAVLPDTVEEFLEAAGPVADAPVETVTNCHEAVCTGANSLFIPAYWRVGKSAHLVWPVAMHTARIGYVTSRGVRALMVIGRGTLPSAAFFDVFSEGGKTARHMGPRRIDRPPAGVIPGGVRSRGEALNVG